MIEILQGDGKTLQRAPRGDVSAHHAGADHMHMLDVRLARIRQVAKCLHAILQLENAHQIGGSRMLVKTGNRVGMILRHLARVALVFEPEFDDGVGRGVVIATCFARDLFQRGARDQTANDRPICHRGLESRLMSRGRISQQCRYRVDKVAAWHQHVNQSHIQRASAIDCATGQHQVQCLRRTDQFRHALGPTPTRDDADHHFRQGHFRLRAVVDDAVLARKCKLGAAAHAEAVNYGDGWKRQHFNLIEYIVAKFGECVGFFGILDGGEFIDIGTRREAIFFRGQYHEAFGRRCF